jgi:hypothetical protein
MVIIKHVNLRYSSPSQSHCIQNAIIVILLLSRLPCFSERESKGKAAWLQLETIHVTSKVTVFQGLSLQESHLVPLPVSSMTGLLGETVWDGRKMDRRTENFGH